MQSELFFQLSLTLVPNIGDVQAKILVQHFGNASSIFKASQQTLERIEGIGEVRAKSIKQLIEVNAAIVLKNIFFDYNKFELKSESQVELDRLVQLMTDNPTVKIQVEGHTDNIGNAADNLKLSDNRAKAVMSYLVSKSIKADRITAKGYGATKPVADNTSEQNRAQNRRTEIKITSK